MEKQFAKGTVKLVKGDITDLGAEAFVYYARHDLKLGTGWGGAIAVRGGPKIQEELDKAGGGRTGEAVVTGAGNLKSRFIIHAVGPRFQEPDTESKLRATVRAALEAADLHGIRQVALPAMGAGFYGVPLDVCSRIMLETIGKYLQTRHSEPLEVVICVNDSREQKPFESLFASMA
jgi:O-acetyl-ADP-ribose deacetylase (regulator of RNase III)